MCSCNDLVPSYPTSATEVNSINVSFGLWPFIQLIFLEYLSEKGMWPRAERETESKTWTLSVPGCNRKVQNQEKSLREVCAKHYNTRFVQK